MPETTPLPSMSPPLWRVNNSGGRLSAGKQLRLNTGQLSGDGALLSKGNLSVQLQGDYTHSAAGQFQADGQATLTLPGKLTNQGTLQAGTQLTLQTSHIDNRADGLIFAATTQLQASEQPGGHLINRGLIDGEHTEIRAHTLTTQGSGRIYGNTLALGVTKLINTEEQLNGHTQASVIAARQQLIIGAQQITNRQHALIYSGGSLQLGGELNRQQQLVGSATQLDNESATIDIQGRAQLTVATLNNRNLDLRTREAVIEQRPVTQYQASGQDKRWEKYAVHDRWCHHEVGRCLKAADGSDLCDYTVFNFNRRITETQVVSSDPGKLLVGGDLQFTGKALNNDNSQVLTGGQLLGSLQQANNINQRGTRVTTDRGSSRYTYVEWHGHLKGGDQRHDADYVPYTPSEKKQITLQIAVERHNQRPQGSGLQLPGRRSRGPAIIACITEVPARSQSTVASQNVIRTYHQQATLPNNALFTLRSPRVRDHLVEVDPRFAHYRTWVNSDYLLKYYPELQLPRLGDGFYEQQLLQEQVQRLTGHRYLQGFSDDNQQYRTLLANGHTAAQAYQLTPGIELTAAQMAQLTSDIVWLVEKPVVLADGRTIPVLVPQLYARVAAGDLRGDGSLLSADSLQLALQGDLTNSGTLAGRRVLSLTAESVQNLAGQLQAERTQVTARRDINNRGGVIRADQQLTLQAGRDLNLVTESTTTVSGDPTGTATHYRRTTLGPIASLHVSGANGTLEAQAGRDINLIAAQLQHRGAHGSSRLQAGRDLTLGTVTLAQRDHGIADANNVLKQSTQQDVGSSLSTQGNLQLQAGNTLQATAATLHSQAGLLQLNAGNDITLRAGQVRQEYEQAVQYRSRSLLGSTTTTTHERQRQISALGSSLSGQRVEVVTGSAAAAPGGNLTLQGSTVISDQQTTLIAKNHLTLQSVTEEEQQHSRLWQQQKRGVFSTGDLAVTLGKQQQRQRQQQQNLVQRGSQVGSLQGDVTLQAGQHYHQQGGGVVAPQGNINITANRVAILAAKNQQQQQQSQTVEQTGLSLTVTNPLYSTVKTLQQLEKASSQTTDSRLHALAAATAGLASKNSVDAIKTNPQQLGGFNTSLSLEHSKQEHHSQQKQQRAQPAQLLSGGHLTIQAQIGDLTVQGSQLQAGKTLQLSTPQQLNLLASENHSSHESQQSSSSSSLGVGVSSSGPALMLGFSEGEGSGQGKSRTHTNTQLIAGQTVRLQSGGDSLLKGAVVTAPQVQAQVGGNLTLESLQESDHQQGKQHTLGINVAVGSNSVSGSVHLNQSHYHSDFESVQQQTGIKAGDQGFQLQVNGNTHLQGAVIASTEQAVTEGRNRLETGTLTQRAIENRAHYEAQSIGGGLGFSKATKQPQQPAEPPGVGKDQQGQATAGAQQVPGSQLPKSRQGLSATLPIVMNASGHDRSTTRSGISGAGKAVTITNQAEQRALTAQTPEQAIAGVDASVTSDQDGSNALAPIFNQQEIEAGFQIVGALTREVGTFLDNRAKEQTKTQKALAEEQGKALEQQDTHEIAALQERLQANQLWEMGGKGRILMSALTMAAGGNITGSTGQLLQAATVNVIQSYGAQQIKLLADSMNSEVARTALQGLLAGAGAAAQGQRATPAALGASTSVVLNNLIDSAYGESSSTLSLSEREARKNLVTSLISGTTHALGGEAALANAAATIEAENNSAAAATWGSMGLAGESLISGVVISEAALVAGGAAALITAPFVGSYYLMKEDVQNDKAAEAILAGDKSLEQVIAQRGRRCGQEVELKIMLKQLYGHMTSEEKLFLQETLSLLNYDISKRELEDLGRKYLPSGFQALNSQTRLTHTGGKQIPDKLPNRYTTPMAEQPPTMIPGLQVTGPLPNQMPGMLIPDTTSNILINPVADPQSKEDLIYNYSVKGAKLKEAASKLGYPIRGWINRVSATWLLIEGWVNCQYISQLSRYEMDACNEVSTQTLPTVNSGTKIPDTSPTPQRVFSTEHCGSYRGTSQFNLP